MYFQNQCHGEGICLGKTFTFCNSKQSIKVMKLAFNNDTNKTYVELCILYTTESLSFLNRNWNLNTNSFRLQLLGIWKLFLPRASKSLHTIVLNIPRLLGLCQLSHQSSKCGAYNSKSHSLQHGSVPCPEPGDLLTLYVCTFKMGYVFHKCALRLKDTFRYIIFCKL